MNEKIRSLLVRSFDEELLPHEKAQLEQALSASALLRRERDELEALRRAFASGAATSFQPGFNARVLAKIRALKQPRENFTTSLSWAFRRIAIAATLAAMAVLVHNFYVEQNISLQAALRLPQPSFELMGDFQE